MASAADVVAGLTTDVFTPAERSAVMRRVKGRNTRPELKLRQLLTRLGLRYRLHRKDLPGSPDVAMIGRKTAIFMHGCFWHGHDCRRGARQPKTNAAYWTAKIARNRARDAENAAALAAMSWRSVTVWECELQDEAALCDRLARLLASTADPREGGNPAASSATDDLPRSPPSRE